MCFVCGSAGVYWYWILIQGSDSIDGVVATARMSERHPNTSMGFLNIHTLLELVFQHLRHLLASRFVVMPGSRSRYLKSLLSQEPRATSRRTDYRGKKFELRVLFAV